MLEALTAIRRAGADLIITYFAKRAAELLSGREPVAASHADHREIEEALAALS
jgi:hypothetical protein